MSISPSSDCGNGKTIPLAVRLLIAHWRVVRWHGQPGEGFAGYTHRESPLGIMVNVRCRRKKLLEIIAEECFHFYQDTIHGTGWRAKTAGHMIESEAGAFVRSKDAEIQTFLEHWEPVEKSRSC